MNLGDSTNEGSPPDNAAAFTFNSLTNELDGLDGFGDTYSLNALAAATGSASTLTWNSQTFFIGPSYINDAVEASGQTFTLPEGSFTAIEFLGVNTWGSNQSDTITVNYVGGGDSSLTQTFSDWHNGYNGNPGTTAPSESIVATMSSYNTPSGNHGGNSYLYAYSISTNASSTVASITLSYNPNITILAIDEVNVSQQYQVILKGRGKGPAGGNHPSPGTGNTGSVSGASPPVAVAPVSGNDLLSLSIDGVVSSAASIGQNSGRIAERDDDAHARRALDQPSGGPLSPPATIILGPIIAPLAPVADYIRAKERSTISLF